MPLLPDAEPYHHIGGPVGALLCHGFTGSPQSLRGWGRHLATAGLTVSVPRLPGHGTSWQEMARTRWEDWYAEVDHAFGELHGRCDTVFVMGLSLGGCLALRLAAQRQDEVTGLVLVNPSLVADDRRLVLLPLLRPFVQSVPGLGNDIKRAEARELAYDRVPVPAVLGLRTLWSTTRASLADIRQPMLVFRSATDHVVGPRSLAALRAGIAPAQLAVRTCQDSYHVATLDNDAEMIFDESLDFVRTHSQTLPERGS